MPPASPWADTLVGRLGADTLTGGAGADIFRLPAPADSSVAAPDRITDFDGADGDRIDLSAIDARDDLAGINPFSFIGAAAFTGTRGELRYTLSGPDTLVEADLDGDGLADLRLLLTGAHTLTAGSFILAP